MTNLLVNVRPDHVERYQQKLATYSDFNVTFVTSHAEAAAVIADRVRHVDVFVVDNEMLGVYEFISELRQSYPRMLIILVDEGADFGMPGQADDITTDPFSHDDLANRIRRMMSDRKQETLRSDSLPAVRNIAKKLRQAIGVLGKQEAAVEACQELGYDYVAYYDIVAKDPLDLTLKAQRGPKAILPIAPKKANADDLMGWVLMNGQSRIAAPEDKPNHPLVARGRLGAVVCVPVSFNEAVFGVVAACRDRPNSITQENVLILELICTQLATMLLREKQG
ncbi:MAG: hypothetical protein OHK0046_46790 [Anaerolineae bacterium]